jgi:hypothetical protein
MKNDEFRQSINDEIKPDYYMKSRLKAKVLSARVQKTKKKKLVPALSVALCFALLVVGGEFGTQFFKNDTQNTTTPTTASVNNFFVLNVSAKEGESLPVNDTSVTFPNSKLNFDGDSLHMSSDTDFTVSGDNIKYVKFTCETGDFDIFDTAKLNYLKDKGEYYDVIVPYTDEYEELTSEELQDLFYKHFYNGDYDEYAQGVEKKNREDYAKVEKIYDDSKGDDYVVSLGLVSCKAVQEVLQYSIKTYTFENYTNDTEAIGNPVWTPNTDLYFENNCKIYSQIPSDTITVTVTFNDDSVQMQKYDFSFNDDGYLVVTKL